MADIEGKSDLDLPLHSNIEDIRVTHYNIELTCDLANKQFKGSVLLVLSSRDFSICSHSESKNEVRSNANLPQNNITENKERDHDIINRDKSQKLYHHTPSNCEHYATCTETKCSKFCDYSVVNQVKEDKVEIKQNGYCGCEHRVTEYNIHEINIESQNEETKEQNPNNTVRLSSDSELKHSSIKDRCNISANIIQETDSLNCDHTYSSPLQTINASTSILDQCDKVIDNDMTKTCQDFVMVLDAWDLIVTSVQEINLKNGFDLDNKANNTRLNNFIQDFDANPLEFCCEKTFLKFWKPGITTSALFPRCVRISYQTQQCGPSLKWTNDQDGRPCVYTHGHWINNRSLFPSQDVPGALSTWQAYINVPEGMTVLMSGDTNPEIIDSSSGTDMTTYIYHTDLEVPSSTLALAVGYWEEVEITSRSSIPNGQLPCRLFTPKCHKEIASSLLCPYVPSCMESAVSLLGPHPFKRLDILIVPASFASLGMASPSLMFLSQSVLSQDGHMLIRVSHELSHSWFGLAIGPCDWHEEWLSEGFATYTEFMIHGPTTQLSEEELKEEREITDYLKYRTLQAELQSTDKDLQMLRKEECDNKRAAYVSNGMNPEKGFLQLHYLKGYFLLRHLEDTVGLQNFKVFLKEFVKRFMHSLIDSMDVIQLFFTMFPNERSVSLSEKTIFRDWLNCPGLPKISVCCDQGSNKMNEEVIELEKKILDCHKIWTKLHWRKRRKLDIESKLHIRKLRQVQILLLLDRLLESEKIHHDILQHLNKKLMLSSTNADVSHKWCELVIRHNLQEYFEDIWHFLVHHQAMGVYLFGELIISRDKAQRNLAENVFTVLSDDMEDGVKKVVQSMIYGN